MFKKGDFQFNWIFVLVAGALFLLFFVGFGIKYKDFQENKNNIEIVNNFDNTLTALQGSSFKTFDVLNLPKTIESKCGKLNVGDREINTDNIIFSSRRLNGKLLMWYEPYKMPFRITSFYYLIPDDVKFYLIEDSGSLSSEILAGLPEDIKKKFNVLRSTDGVIGKGKLIFLNKIDNKGISIIGDVNKGKIVVNGKEFSYVGRELLYGAIFSDDYGCLLDRVQAETSNIGGIYKEKINLIRDVRCDYTFIVNGISSLQSKLDFELANKIDEENSRLIGNGCAGVF